MIEHLSKNYRTIRIPGNRNSIAVKAKEARSVIYSREGREATEEEMLDYIKTHLKNTEHLTVRDMTDILSADKKAWSLDQPLSEHGESESTLLDVYDGTVGSGDSVYDQENFKHIIGVLMSGLTSREVEVVERVHAIGNSLFPNSLTEVGISWGISTEAVRVVYRKALKKMQIKARKLKINISSIF
jgi:DNA-directed RNA polymerase sigma subunit (sigma70/sigma32)